MKIEKSAGGIIVRRVSKTWEMLLIKDMNGNWTFPKGIIESGEIAESTALREIKEEVGLTALKYIDLLGNVNYSFKRDGNTVNKTVTYYLFILTLPQNISCQIEEGISDYCWVKLDIATEIVGYPKTNSHLIGKVKDILLTL
jgi:bis(5'-nucleosidyl)-tetraphosphatase